MTRRATICALLGLAAAIGCRTKPYVNAHIESLNAEYRQLEDYVYALEEENARLQQERDALRAGRIDATRSDPPGSDRPPSAAPRRSVPRALPEPGDRFPADEPPMIEIPDVPSPAPPPTGRSTRQRPASDPLSESDPLPPEIELPQQGDPAEPLPLPAPRPGERSPPAPEVLPPQPLDRRVTQLFLNPALTNASKESGLTVVLEPRNDQQQYVPQPGKLSVVVLDPSRQGDAARVARWDFDAQATEQLLRQTRAAPGIRLDLSWPGLAPDNDRLHVFARYETDDGRRLQTDHQVAIAKPGETLSRWTPRPAERQRPAASQAQVAAATSVEPASHQSDEPERPPTGASSKPPAEWSDEPEGRLPVPAWSPHR